MSYSHSFNASCLWYTISSPSPSVQSSYKLLYRVFLLMFDSLCFKTTIKYQGQCQSSFENQNRCISYKMYDRWNRQIACIMVSSNLYELRALWNLTPTNSITRRKLEFAIPNNVVNATYCNVCRWTGISFAMSWWIRGKNGGQFFSSMTIPAEKNTTIH